MKTHPHKLSSRYLLLSLLSFTFSFAISGIWVGSAQTDPCAEFGATVNNTDGVNFRQGDTVYVEMDYRFDQNQRSQVVQGFASWIIANQNNNSRIHYETNGRPASAPANASQINVTYGVIYNRNGTVAYDIPARFEPHAFNSDGTLRVATIVFNTAATASGTSGGTPFYDPNAPVAFGRQSNGYESVYKKMTEHEVGHGQRIDHPVRQQPGRSVMNGASRCPNENCDQLPPDGVQPCDNAAVNRVAGYPPPGGGAGGNDPMAGGGGAGGCPSVDCFNPENNQDPMTMLEGGESSCPTFQSSCGSYCPVLIDVAGDGFRLTDAAGGVRFDLNRDGRADQLAWTAADSDDAWLVLDRNGNSVIDDGAEVFGNYTSQPPSPAPNGFLALAEFDNLERGGNADGVIDGGDAIFPSLRLWQDMNHNGFSEFDELHTLASLDVAALRLDYKESKRTDEHGNRFRYRAKVDDAKGAKVGRRAWDVFIVRAP